MFIASSTEALPIARAVREQFEREADVDIWDENVFALNRSNLENLLNRASYYDFGIAVITPDDEAVIRDRAATVPRDNVVFEFGLFLGRLGPNRAFMIVQEGVELFSDWDGVAKARFTPRDNLVAAVGSACNKIREEMDVASSIKNFTMLPSTSLAIGYYHNFLKRIFDAFESEQPFTIVERDEQGSSKESEFKIGRKDRYPTIHVKLPEDLQNLGEVNLKRHIYKSDYKQIIVKTDIRNFPFYIQGDVTAGTQGDLTLFDVPTTMLSSYLAIKSIFPQDFLARKGVLAHFQKREIANFQRTVEMSAEPAELESIAFSTL